MGNTNKAEALVFVCGVSGMVFIGGIALMNDRPEFDRAYWSAIYSAFAFFLSLCWLAWPSIVTYRHGHLTEQAKMRHDREVLGQPPTVSAASGATVEQKPAPTRYGELWRLYWVEMFTYFEQCGGIGFNKTKDFFGKNRPKALATWRQAMKPLVQQGIVWPIAQGELTELCEGFTIQGVRMWLENGHNVESRYIPALPPPAPHESAPDQPGEPA